MKVFHVFLMMLLFIFFCVHAEEKPGLLVAAGKYQVQEKDELPLIFINTGKDWQQIEDIANLPADPRVQYSPSSVALSTKYSVITGRYVINNVTRPLILISTDNSKSWSLAHVSQFPDKYFPLRSSFCHQYSCLAVGDFQGKEDDFHAAVLRMQENDPLSWEFYDVSAQLPTNTQDTTLEDVKCTDEWCVAAGSILTRDQRSKPLIISSKDHGQTWTYHNIKFPYLHGDITSLACKDKTCLGGGRFLTIEELDPIMTYSVDAGKTWRVTRFALRGNSSFIRQVAFAENNWLAVGSTHAIDGSSKISPIIILSADKGKTWKPAKIPSLDLSPYMTLNQISCVKSHCTAVGRSDFVDKKESKIFIFTSEDDGLTWANVENIDNYPADVNLDEISPHSLYCSHQGCTSVNTYIKGNLFPGILSEQNNEGWNLSFIQSQYNNAELNAVGGLD